MSVAVVFNELSIDETCSLHCARTLMEQFVKILKEIRLIGAEKSLRRTEEFWNYHISDAYTISDWSNDNKIDKEIRLSLKGNATKYPLIDSSEESHENLAYNEFSFENKRAVGLGAAFILDGISVSLKTSDIWSKECIEIEKQELTSNAEIESSTVCIKHVCEIDHVKAHRAWVLVRKADVLKTGDDIWNKRNEVYPNIEFCENVKSQLTGIMRSNNWLKSIKEILRLINDEHEILQNCICAKKIGAYSLSNETNMTLNTPVHRESHSFVCPDGEKRVFGLHVKGPQLLRIHFLKENDKVFIGHIGGHLSTVRYSH